MAALGAVLFLSLLIASVLAGDFSLNPVPSTLESDSPLNISLIVTDINDTENITSINLTFPSGLVFIVGSDYTNATGTQIANTTYFVYWNSTSGGWIIPNRSSAYFNASFYNMNAPGDYAFNITANFTDNSKSNHSSTITVQDTTSPSGITLISPASDSWIAASSTFINLSYTELNPHSCFYDNGTSNITNTTSSSPCQLYVTGYSEGNWTYSLYLNDTSGNLAQNGTYTLNYDNTDPSLNSLGIFHSTGNVSGGNITTRENVTISLNITDSLSGVNSSAVWANVYNDSGGLVKTVTLSQANGNFFNGTWDTGNDNTGDGVYTINVNGTDDAGNAPSTGIVTTLELLGAPDLTITGVDWTSSNSLPGCPTSIDSVTLNITIKNIGDANFTESFNVNISVDSTLRVSHNLDNTSLDEGEYITLNATLTSGNFTSNKRYTFDIALDPEDAVAESAEDNNTYSLAFNLGYNISLREFAGTAYPSLGSAYPNTNVSVNVSVTCGNGSGVSGLNQNAFQFKNKWGADIDNVTDRIYSFTTDTGAGNYSFKFNTEDLYISSNRTRAEFDDNYLNVSASSGSYYGYSMLLYNITAPDLKVSISEVDDLDNINLRGADYKEVDFNVTLENEGNAPIYDIEIDEDNDFDDVNWILPDDFTLDHTTIDSLNLDPGEQYEFTVELRVEEEHDPAVYFYLFVYGNDTVDNRYRGFDNDRAKVVDTGSSDDGDDGGTTGGGDTGSDLDLELTLMDWDDEISGYPGEDNTTRVEVKNTGDVTVVAKVSFTCSVVSDTTIAPTSKSLAVGSTQEFIINFDIEEDAEIGEYDCTVKAYVSSAESNYDSETTVVKVLATAEQAEEIKEMHENVSGEVRALLDRFRFVNQALVNENNYTRVKNVMDNLNSTLQEIKDAIDDEDYITANELLQSLQASLTTAENSLSELELEQSMGGGFALSGTWYWVVIIIVVVIAVAFVAYLFFPQKKGYGPKKGIFDTLSDSVKGGTNKLGDIKDSGKDRLGALKPEPKGYEYKKGPAAKIKGAINKIKEKLKRKKKPQKEVTQYFVSSSSNIINYT